MSDTASHTQEPDMERYSQYRILAVDDQESITSLIEKLIQMRLGCDIVSLSSGDEALARLGSECFDIMVTDMLMPGTHGTELVKRIHRLCPDMNIIVMTGYSEDFPYVEVIRAGADDFINKPFRPAEMEAKLVRLFEERALRRRHMIAESKYRGLFELSGDGMALLGGDHATIVDVNNALREMVGREEAELVGASILRILDPEDGERLKEGLEICLSVGKGTLGDLRLRSAEGGALLVDMAATFINIESEKMVFLAFKDVTEKREVVHRLAEVAHKDPLTGLYNKRSFQARIEWAVGNARQKGVSFVLLGIDLDNFKRCNDTHGHQVGDKLLDAVGKVILKSIRAAVSDEAFRIGGDEFSVILRGTNKAGSRVVAERMRSTFEHIENYGTSLSIGLAEYAAGERAEEVIRHADEALYRAKAAGKNSICEA